MTDGHPASSCPEQQNTMTEINQLCAPILVYQEDVKENRATAQRKKETLKETSCAPVCILYAIKFMGSKQDRSGHRENRENSRWAALPAHKLGRQIACFLFVFSHTDV